MLKTRRLTVEPYRERDLPELLALLSDEGIRRNYMLPDFPTPKDAVRMAERLLRISRSPEHYERGIFLSDRLIGFVNDVEIGRREMELGYAIHPAFANQGYATEMLQAVAAALFALGCRRITAHVFADNPASIRVLEKCGMTRLRDEEHLLYRGEWRLTLFYALDAPNP